MRLASDLPAKFAKTAQQAVLGRRFMRTGLPGFQRHISATYLTWKFVTVR